MIELIGVEGSSEYRAAEMVARAIEATWPGATQSPIEIENIKIAVSAKLSGYQVQDIDVVMCGLINKPRSIRPARSIRDAKGNRLNARPIKIESFVVAIEVKDQGENSVRVRDDQVEVKYSRGGPPRWKSATDQNVKQLHAIKGYLEDQHVDVFARRCILMPSLATISAPSALASGFNGHQLFSAIASTMPIGTNKGQGVLSAGSKVALEKALVAPLFRSLVPTQLDRKKMDMLSAKSGAVENVINHIGATSVFLRGHGGTGKTVALLQAAWRLYRLEGKRALFLTYNHALAADIRRTMALMNVPVSVEDGGIAVETVMSFMFKWFSRFHMLDSDELDYGEYPSLCMDASEMISSGAVNASDIQSIKENEPELFDYDFVFIDEGQDWPECETILLKQLYHSKQLCVADGIDQLIRGKKANWGAGISNEKKEIITLTKCMRLKRNLSLFAASIAQKASLGWEVEPNDKAGGGRIIVLQGPYAEAKDLHSELVDSLYASGNAEIDMLFCVPPTNVNEVDGVRRSSISEVLQQWGSSIWDGVDPTARHEFPRSKEMFRIVQYESCRGLEGWIVVLEGFDKFLESKVSQKISRGLSEEEEQSFVNLTEVSEREAWRWASIALTRPIDTLVIQLQDPESMFSKALLEMASKFEDFVEIH
jgi:hypothetical protein